MKKTSIYTTEKVAMRMSEMLVKHDKSLRNLRSEGLSYVK